MLVVLAAAGYVGYEAWQRVYVHPYEQLRRSMHAIQLSIERYAVDMEGSYPRQLEDLLEHGYVEEWPENPFRPGEPLPILEAADPWQPGGIVYVATGPIISTSEDGLRRMRLDAAGNSGMEANTDNTDSVPAPTEFDQYLLISYGPRRSGRPAPALDQMAQFGRYSWQPSSELESKEYEGWSAVVYTPADIAWEHVHCMAMAGEEIVCSDG